MIMIKNYYQRLGPLNHVDVRELVLETDALAIGSEGFKSLLLQQDSAIHALANPQENKNQSENSITRSTYTSIKTRKA